MRKILSTLALSAALAVPLAANAVDGVPSVYYVPTGADTRPCVFVQFYAQTGTAWYSVNRGDGNFNSVNSLLLTSIASGAPITTSTSGVDAACSGFAKINGVYMGVYH